MNIRFEAKRSRDNSRSGNEVGWIYERHDIPVEEVDSISGDTVFLTNGRELTVTSAIQFRESRPIAAPAKAHWWRGAIDSHD